MSRFAEAVYEVVRRIPAGKVMTYGSVARAIGNPRSARAVGGALKKNVDFAVPCHRVIASDGSLGGYNRGPEAKRQKLRDEGVTVPIKEKREILWDLPYAQSVSSSGKLSSIGTR